MVDEQQPAPRFPHQPGRRKFARDPDIERAWRRKAAAGRPICAACGTTAPAPDEPREDWLEAYGHRAPNGEPCPSQPVLPHVWAAMQAAKRPAAAFPASAPMLLKSSVQLALFDAPKPANDVHKPKRLRVRVIKQVSDRPPAMPVLPLFESVEGLLQEVG